MDGISLIAAERKRQIEQEGWTLEHDTGYTHGELAGAGSAYAMSAAAALASGITTPIKAPPPFFRFGVDFWKPTTPLRDLVKAGALIAAEIDRLLRAEAKAVE